MYVYVCVCVFVCLYDNEFMVFIAVFITAEVSCPMSQDSFFGVFS